MYIDIISDAPADLSWIFSVLFATRQCPCRLEPRGNGNFNGLTLVVEVPSLPASEWAGRGQVPLRIHVQDAAISTISLAHFGIFRYTDIVHQPALLESTATRKRKNTDEDTTAMARRGKRPSVYQSRPPSGVSHDGPRVSYPVLRRSADLDYGAVIGQHPPDPHGSLGFQGYAPPSYVGGAVPARRMPATSLNYNVSLEPALHGGGERGNTGNQTTTPTGLSPTREPAAASSTPMVAPTFIRTTLQACSLATAAGMGAGAQPGTFNPYGLFPSHRATLRIEGDLNSMAHDWDEDEKRFKRRLVQFQRSQSGSVITTSFEPVKVEERQPNSICISCIFWEATGECYVTSVDTIYLLQRLVHIQYPTEEKNRVRRNMETFHPLTVRKNKADTEDLFKLIMSFPAPKPRNIEKDVKVYSWRILAHALKKIIDKYVRTLIKCCG